MAKILIVEDDPKQLKLYGRALRGYRLTCVATGSSAPNGNCGNVRPYIGTESSWKSVDTSFQVMSEGLPSTGGDWLQTR